MCAAAFTNVHISGHEFYVLSACMQGYASLYVCVLSRVFMQVISGSLNTYWFGQMQTDICSPVCFASWPCSQKGLSAWAWCHGSRAIQIMGSGLFIFSQLIARARQGKLAHLGISQSLLKIILWDPPCLLIVLYNRLTKFTFFTKLNLTVRDLTIYTGEKKKKN